MSHEDKEQNIVQAWYEKKWIHHKDSKSIDLLKNGYFLGPKKKSYEKIEKRSIQFFLKRESQNTKSPD